MHALLDPFSFLALSLAGWMNQHQQHVIHYLMEENRILREQIGNRRMRFTDDQRRRLAPRAKNLAARVASIVTPETLLAWHISDTEKVGQFGANREPSRRLRTGDYRGSYWAGGGDCAATVLAEAL